MGQDVYSIHQKHYVAVDCVIFGFDRNDGLQVLLHPRGFEPLVGKWSLLGGFVTHDETLGDAARRILFNTTGLVGIFQQQVHAFSRPDRDPAGRVISVAYYALIRINQQDIDLVNQHGAQWWPVAQLPELIFDHREMIDNALLRLQEKAETELVGRELLGDLFTMSNLKKLYEAIYQKNLDPGNFRKKILSLGVLMRTSLKDMTDSKKGAFLYQYMEKSQRELIIKLIRENR